MKREHDSVRDYKAIRGDYLPDGSPFDEDEPRCAAVKRIIENDLDPVERTILLLYVDCLSFRKLGRRFGLSHTTMRKEVARIKNKVITIYESLH